MTRLRTELQRLYLCEDGRRCVDDRVRAMELELAGSWEAPARVWQGVQADLQLPAPAIAVSGHDGYQLWFSLAQPVPVARAAAFLQSLRVRYLADVAQERIVTWPSVDASSRGEAQPDRVLPPAQAAPERWSAFVSPDLAAVFAGEPWLDLPPNPDAQADLLARLDSMRPDDFQRAIDAPGAAGPQQAAERLDPRRFLLEVMNDPAVELRLRIEAAKALLPGFERQGSP